MRTSCASLDSTALHRVGAIRVPTVPSSTNIARGSPMLVHGATAFESEEGEMRALSFRTVPWLPASNYDPMSIVRAPCISRGAATTSDVVRGPYEEAAGEDIVEGGPPGAVGHCSDDWAA